MKINRNPWTSMKINRNPYKLTKINKNQWKFMIYEKLRELMKIIANQQKSTKTNTKSQETLNSSSLIKKGRRHAAQRYTTNRVSGRNIFAISLGGDLSEQFRFWQICSMPRRTKYHKIRVLGLISSHFAYRDRRNDQRRKTNASETIPNQTYRIK